MSAADKELGELQRSYADALDERRRAELERQPIQPRLEEVAMLRAALLKVEKDKAELLESVRWIAQTGHQGRHDGSLLACPKVTCCHAKEILRRMGVRV